MPDQKLFTVIIALRGATHDVGETLESLRNQTFRNFEVVIISGGVSPTTETILRDYADLVDTFVDERDSGITSAWNKGLDVASGEWVHFLGSGDTLAGPTVLQRVAERLTKTAPSTNIVYGKVALVDGSHVRIDDLGTDWRRARKTFPRAMSIPHQGVFHRKSMFERLGNFNEMFCVAGDYEFLLRDVLDNDPVYLDFEIAQFKQGGLSSDPARRISVIKEYIQIQKLHGLPWYPAMYFKALALAFIYRLVGRKGLYVIVDAYRLVTFRTPCYLRYFHN